jgi:hypothetical protein
VFSALPDPAVDERFRTELNLHRHLAVLAAAWLITGKDKYGKELLAQLTEWIDMNPPVNDTNLNDGLELAARVVMWTHCLFLLRGFFIERGQYLTILHRIEVYGSLIERNYNAARIFSQGIHAEQSATYHLFVLECYQLTALLCRQNQISLNASFVKRVEEATEYVLFLRKPNGKLPLIGNTAFKFFCPTGDARHHADTFLAVGAILFDNSQWAGVIPRPNEEVFWLIGAKALSRVGEGRSSTAPTSVKVFAEAGHVIARSGWDSRAHYLHFDCGPQGLGEHAAHGHDDVLSVEFDALGQSFCVDSGMYTYVRSHRLWEYFTGARAHNTVVVNGKGPAVPGPEAFGWSRVVTGELVEAASFGGVGWFTGRHTGYSDKNSEIIVERSLLVLDSEYLLVVDRVTGSGVHSIETLFHFDPDVSVTCAGNVADGRGSNAYVRVCVVSSNPTRLSLHRGEDPAQPGWYSGAYGILQPAFVIRAFSRSALPFWRVTGLFPKERCPEAAVNCEKIQVAGGEEGGDTAVLKFSGWQMNVSDFFAVSWGQRALSVSDVTTNARMVLLRESNDGAKAYVLGGEIAVPKHKIIRINKLKTR